MSKTKHSFKLRRFSENVCDNRPLSRRKTVNVTISIDEGTEEKLQVLAEFSEPNVPFSVLVNDILMDYLNVYADAEEIKRAYAKWQKQRP